MRGAGTKSARTPTAPRLVGASSLPSWNRPRRYATTRPALALVDRRSTTHRLVNATSLSVERVASPDIDRGTLDRGSLGYRIRLVSRHPRSRVSREEDRSPSRKKAQEPSRKRSTRPASSSSRRWREMRGCDWRRMSVRSETVSSASAKSATMRSRVSSPAALRAPFRVGKDIRAGAGMVQGTGETSYKDIFIRLIADMQGPVGFVYPNL